MGAAAKSTTKVSKRDGIVSILDPVPGDALKRLIPSATVTRVRERPGANLQIVGRIRRHVILAVGLDKVTRNLTDQIPGD